MMHWCGGASGRAHVQQVVIDREGMADEFLAQLQQEGRQVITLLRADQYEGEESFAQVGQWQPWRYSRRGQLICEVAAARFTLRRPDPADPAVSVEVALIRDWRKRLSVERANKVTYDGECLADLPDHPTHFF